MNANDLGFYNSIDSKVPNPRPFDCDKLYICFEKAEKEHDRLVAEEEAEELAKQKKEEEKAEQAALEAARNSP